MSENALVTCIHHPGREAMGVCVRCRSRYCSECITKVDGVNYCAGCLRELSKSKELGARGRELSLPLRLAATLGWFVLLTALTWTAVELVFPGRH